MKEFIEYLVKEIVSKPEAVAIEEVEEKGFFTYNIQADKDDMGVLIGKEGRTIRSIRNMAKAKAIKDDIKIQVILEEND